MYVAVKSLRKSSPTTTKSKTTRSLHQSPVNKTGRKSSSPSFQPTLTDRFLNQAKEQPHEQSLIASGSTFAHVSKSPREDVLNKYLNVSNSARTEHNASYSLSPSSTPQSARDGYRLPSASFSKKFSPTKGKTTALVKPRLNSTVENTPREEYSQAWEEKSSLKQKLESIEDQLQYYLEKIFLLEKENQRLQFQVTQKDKSICELVNRVRNSEMKLKADKTTSQIETERSLANLETKKIGESIKVNSENELLKKIEPQKIMVSKATQVNWSEDAASNGCAKCSRFMSEYETVWSKLEEIEEVCKKVIESNFRLQLENSEYKQLIENKELKLSTERTRAKGEFESANAISQELKSEVEAVRSFIKNSLLDSLVKVGKAADKSSKWKQRSPEITIATQNISRIDHFPAFMKAVTLGSTIVKNK